MYIVVLSNKSVFSFLCSLDWNMALFPNSLTEEEETLQKKYAKLKKKVETRTVQDLICPTFMHKHI